MPKTKYQYETSPRKIDPEYKGKKKSNLKVVENKPRESSKLSKGEKQKRAKVTLVIIAIFAVLLTISYRNSQINEEFSEIQTLKKELSSTQKENEQQKVSIENSLNLNYIEQVAKEKLGMQKLTNKQTVHITLPKKDYTESASEKVVTQEANAFEKFVNKLFNKE